jgi:bifunctional non-homologous end joining protein LigD
VTAPPPWRAACSWVSKGSWPRSGTAGIGRASAHPAGWRSNTIAGTIGSLALGIPDDDGLRYVGRVGTGFGDQELDDLTATLRPLTRKTSPLHSLPAADARGVHWVTPKLVGEVEFAEWTHGGRLRQPSWRGLRPDKAPEDVVDENPSA